MFQNIVTCKVDPSSQLLYRCYVLARGNVKMISHDQEKGISNDKQDFSLLVRNEERKNSVGKGRAKVSCTICKSGEDGSKPVSSVVYFAGVRVVVLSTWRKREGEC